MVGFFFCVGAVLFTLISQRRREGLDFLGRVDELLNCCLFLAAEAKLVPERSADQKSRELSKLVSDCSNVTAETLRFLRRLALRHSSQRLCLSASRNALSDATSASRGSYRRFSPTPCVWAGHFRLAKRY